MTYKRRHARAIIGEDTVFSLKSGETCLPTPTSVVVERLRLLDSATVEVCTEGVAAMVGETSWLVR
jgi:hypothetical protein